MTNPSSALVPLENRPNRGGLPRTMHKAVGTITWWWAESRRDQRGLSQSTESAVLITGTVALALTVVGLIGAYISRRLGELG